MNQELNCWINVFKPKNLTSFDVIKKIRHRFKLKKIGHAGTLDPLAEGILPIAIGKTTKLISLINNQIKSYEFEIKWGEQTSTDDTEGDIINLSPKIPSDKEIISKLKNFEGEILQKPPKASSVKINGERAYKLFRNKVIFETKPKFVKVFNAKLISMSKKNISKFNIDCGKGFYVRSFARDFAQFLNTRGHIYSLKRSKVGKFKEKNSILLDDLLKISQMSQRIKGFYPSIFMLDDIPALEVDKDEILQDIYHGKKVKINFFNFTNSLNQKEKNTYIVKKKDYVVSIGEIYEDYFKPKKVFL